MNYTVKLPNGGIETANSDKELINIIQDCLSHYDVRAWASEQWDRKVSDEDMSQIVADDPIGCLEDLGCEVEES